MPTAPPPQPPSGSAHAQVELTLTLELDPDSPTALIRTLVLLHRRRCRVTEAEYRSRIDGSDYLDLRVQAPPAHAHCLPAWLSALLEVRCVKHRATGTISSSFCSGPAPELRGSSDLMVGSAT